MVPSHNKSHLRALYKEISQNEKSHLVQLNSHFDTKLSPKQVQRQQWKETGKNRVPLTGINLYQTQWMRGKEGNSDNHRSTKLLAKNSKIYRFSSQPQWWAALTQMSVAWVLKNLLNYLGMQVLKCLHSLEAKSKVQNWLRVHQTIFQL